MFTARMSVFYQYLTVGFSFLYLSSIAVYFHAVHPCRTLQHTKRMFNASNRLTCWRTNKCQSDASRGYKKSVQGGIKKTMCLKHTAAESDLLKGFAVRLARDEDYAIIMNIVPDLYGGRDYLPKYYHAMIRHPNRIPLLFYIDKEVLGFGIFLIINDGRTVLRQAGRVVEKYRGRGFSALVFKHALDFVWKRYPRVAELQTVLTGDNIFKSLVTKDKTVQRHSYRILTRVRIEEFGSMSIAIPGLRNDTERAQMDEATRILTPSEAMDTLCTLEDVHAIRGEYLWLVNGELFAHCDSDYRILTQSNVIPAVVAVTHDDPCGNKINALSFTAKTKLREGLLFRVDFYCAEQHRTSSMGRRLLKYHILKHLALFVQVNYKGLLYIDVVLPKEMMTPGLTGTWLSELLPNQQHSLLEKEMKVYFVEFNVEQFRNTAKL